MIKTTITKDTLRNKFARSGAKKIGTGKCIVRPTVNCIVLNNYSSLGFGENSDKKINNNINNVILFKKQKEVA